MLLTLLQTDPSAFLLLSISLIFSLSFHEFSHSFMALRLGDDTSYRLNRTNINPINHLDPIGTLMIFFVGFGWAKPVPVNPYNLKNPTKDMMKIAFAGPASNLLLAFLSLLIIKIFSSGDSVFMIFYYINLALAVFNLLPITPLDGSQIFNPIIHKFNPQAANFLTQYGSQILFGLILFGLFTGYSILWKLMSPIISLINYIFVFLVSFLW